MENSKKKGISVDELAEAFKPEKKPKKKAVSIIVLIIGALTLIAGVIVLIVKLASSPVVQDGEYLTSVEEWVLDNPNCEPGTSNDSACEQRVIWKFTEIGKGTLTTNNHLNDYDFIWAIEDNKLKIETDWLYDLQNEYEYTLDQNSNTLTLKADDKEFRFTGIVESE